MDSKRFDKLKKRDFDNGATIDEIYSAIKDGENARAELTTLRAENARLRAEVEAADELREEISSWLKMLTTEIFTEPDFVKARALLEAGGMTLDGISASNMRHVLTRLAEKDKQARAARLTRADGDGEVKVK